MRIKFESRASPHPAALIASPAIAVALSMLVGAALFSSLGYDGGAAVHALFVRPVVDVGKWQDLAVKASPLILIALGLSVGFRAGVWNIGGEGQYVLGGLGAAAVALASWRLEGFWILPAMIVAGTLAGALYAAIPALLRVRLKVSETLSSLMLTYVAVQLLYYLTRGPWKDPEGFNFPQTRLFTEHQILPPLFDGAVIHSGVALALLIALLAQPIVSRTVFGYRMRAHGFAPRAAHYAGFHEGRTIMFGMLCGGAAAGLAGALEAAGPFAQMTPHFPSGYGFAAIIVAFLGRLHPLGVIPAGLALAVTYVGGENAQVNLGLPAAAAGVFQAMTLFFLLACDALSSYRLRIVKSGPAVQTP